MDPTILKTVGEIAGIGGLSLGVVLLLFRDVIRKNIFPLLGVVEAYKLLRLIVILVFMIGVAGLAAWVYTTQVGSEYQPAHLSSENKVKFEYELSAGNWCVQNHRPQEALAHYAEAAKLDPKNPDIQKGITSAQLQLGR
jgi:hypothetical protein